MSQGLLALRVEFLFSPPRNFERGHVGWCSRGCAELAYGVHLGVNQWLPHHGNGNVNA
ncbi:hypothetical protein COLO4_37450 [Corchorus olitorius]|uniref:Uncharacterized protein n=1 Tax=Corchorus olitorius TaxID=93759 RepID=A0A1R3G1L5_9ROSI|nr:hypothetical protein COLO4_37450 [Corchorus olitorius]